MKSIWVRARKVGLTAARCGHADEKRGGDVAELSLRLTRLESTPA